MKTVYILLALFIFASCKKNYPAKINTIEGQLLESTGNPVPVSNYPIIFSQAAERALLGGINGIDANVKTGVDGKFKFQYNSVSGRGVDAGLTNANNIILYGFETSQFPGLQPYWSAISPAIDTNLNTLYLYKNIKALVRKVKFNNPLNTGDTLQLRTPGFNVSDFNIITGPVATGTLLTVDTVRNCRLTDFTLSTQQYYFSFSLFTRSYTYNNTLTIHLPKGDEAFREVTINY